ncbi:tetratricopeptide repeat protein [Bordetella genomosp. 5]|nr:hypothetical protein [Bordetella genomosp. 5]
MNDSPATLPDTAASPEAAFVLDADEARMLTEMGFLAAGRGDVQRADAIFQALRTIRPARAYPWLGLAVARLNAGRAPEAVTVLEQGEAVLVGAHGDEAVLLAAWRGFALQLAGRNAESLRLLQVCARGTGEAASLAQALLGITPEADASADGASESMTR